MAPTDCLGETWTDLCARLDGEQRLTCWAERETALAGVSGLRALAAVVHSGQSPEDTDEILAALLRLAAADNGDDMDAALVVAHLMHNAARAIAVSLRDLSPDVDAVVASALWVQIRGYRWRQRRHGHAKGLKQDTRAAVVAELCPARTTQGKRRMVLLAPQAATWLYEQAAAGDPASAGGGSDREPADELLDVLTWARSSGVLTGEDVELLLVFELASLPERYEAAAAHGVHEQTLRRRCRAAKARLREARLDYLEQAA
jgi:hypothetical protein